MTIIIVKHSKLALKQCYLFTFYYKTNFARQHIYGGYIRVAEKLSEIYA